MEQPENPRRPSLTCAQPVIGRFFVYYSYGYLLRQGTDTQTKSTKVITICIEN